MQSSYNVLIMGASYGSLLATKLLLAGHTAKLVCLPAEADLINSEGTRVRMPVRGRDGLVEIDSRKLPGKLSAGGPAEADPSEYDLVALAMQEPQYRSTGVRELLASVARSGVPCMSIMNMPPLPYLERIPGRVGRCVQELLHRCERLGRFRPRHDDAVQPGRAGVSPARRKGQRAAGEPADQLQGGPLRVGCANGHSSADSSPTSKRLDSTRPTERWRSRSS